jgi:quinol monooxygenase YgiN
MSVTYVITFTVAPGERQRFLDLLNGVLDAMREEPMFMNATLHSDPENANRFLLHETWTDHQDVLDVQLKRPYREAWHEALPTLLERPREIGIWRALRADRRPEPIIGAETKTAVLPEGRCAAVRPGPFPVGDYNLNHLQAAARWCMAVGSRRRGRH